jgi:uncharacterized membrane protein
MNENSQNLIQKNGNGKAYQREEVRDKARKVLKTFKHNANLRRTIGEKIADFITAISGSFLFLLLNTIWFIVWIVINLDMVPGVKAFDPFPFGLLTMIVSLEAIILSTIVLISQNREAKINDLRDEVDTRIDIVTEEKVAKCLELLHQLLEKHDVDLSKDKKLHKMIKPEDPQKLEKKFSEQI